MLDKAFREMLARDNFVILDTETTGIYPPAHVCEVSIINRHSRPLLDTLVQISGQMPAAAFVAHGISDAMLLGAPGWPEVKARLLEVIRGKDVITYNAIFDRKMLHASDDIFGLPATDYKKDAAWYCAMEWYAELFGDVHPYYGSYKWQSLTNAVAQCGLPPFPAHRAINDCLATLAVIKAKTPDCELWVDYSDIPF